MEVRKYFISIGNSDSEGKANSHWDKNSSADKKNPQVQKSWAHALCDLGPKHDPMY